MDGLSGAGKSSVYEELIRRGYKAISTDRAWAYHADPDSGLPGGPIQHDTFMWNPQKAVSELESREPELLFVCGSSRNRDRFLPYFTKIFNLRIDDDTMRRRLQERTEDDWPLGQEGVELIDGVCGASRLCLNTTDGVAGPGGRWNCHDGTSPADHAELADTRSQWVRRWEFGGKKLPTTGLLNQFNNTHPWRYSSAMFHGWEGGASNYDCEPLYRELSDGPQSFAAFGSFSIGDDWIVDP